MYLWLDNFDMMMVKQSDGCAGDIAVTDVVACVAFSELKLKLSTFPGNNISS